MRIVQVLTAGTQQDHGAVHCLAAAYPRLSGNRSDEARPAAPPEP